jgi:anti-sigma factor RsiW
VDHEQARALISGRLDGELDPAHDLELGEHLKGCVDCTREYEAARVICSRLLGGELRYWAPARLEKRIRAALPREAARPREESRAMWWLRRTLPIAAPIAVAALLVLSLNPGLFGPAADDSIGREVVASHVRSLMAAHLTDVASSDQHTVKPYFEGKLDFSPPVSDFAAQGFKLVGGRLDYLDQRPVAALIYQHGKHAVNVFIWPAANGAEAAEKDSVRQGYNLAHFARGGMNYWVVSNLNRIELEKLVAMLKQ